MSRRKRRYAVTGATGFVGRRLIRALVREDCEVVALVRDLDAARSIVDCGAAVHEWSVEDAKDKVAILENADVLFHAAAHVPLRYDDPAEASACFRVNAQGTFDLFKAAETVGVPQIVHFSTGNMYAPAPGLVREDAAMYPSERAPFYLASKLTGDIYADFLRRTEGLRIATLRVASAYGPGMNPGGLIPGFVGKVLAGERLNVHDGGRYGVDLVYVDDVVAGAMSAADRSTSGIFNVGSGERVTTLQIAETLLRIAGASPESMVLEPALGQSSPQGHPGLNISRARSELGFSPTPLESGLRSYVEYRRSDGEEMSSDGFAGR